MALQTFPGGGLWINPWPYLGNPQKSNSVMDAAGESVSFIGPVVLSSGPGTSKTISSAGGSIYWIPDTVTFANGTTNIRVGIQDVGAGTRLEDGVFDVQADLVGGTDTITADVPRATAMESGTKTIAHGDNIAIVIEMTARGGADAVSVGYQPDSVVNIPNVYVGLDTGAGPVATSGGAMAFLVFDDGTFGWLPGTVTAEPGTVSPTTATTPDEYATIFRVSVPTTVVGVTAVLDNVDTSDTFDVILYSDPLGTPVAERTTTAAPNVFLSNTADGLAPYYFTSSYTLTAGVDYAVAVRPTSANAISIYRFAFGASNGNLRASTMLGTSWSQGVRSDQTGAFTQDTTILSCIGPILGAFDDGVSAGGGSNTIMFVAME